MLQIVFLPKLGRLASEEVIVQLLKQKCMPILLYGLDVCMYICMRGTVYRQLSAQPPHRLLPLKKNLNHFCLDCHSVCDNVYRSLTMFSDLAAVCTVDCAIEIVLITLHYITI